MINFTFEEFTKAAEDAGFLDQFSEADLKLAKENPNAGMGLLYRKIDWANATTPEQRALINEEANGIRREHGGYTAGVDGSGYYLEPLSPSSFTLLPAPTYEKERLDNIYELAEKQLNYPSFESSAVKPTYTDRYDGQIQGVLGEITNREEFSYDPDTDPLYSSYKKQYAREGQRATADTLGEAAAASGGIPSSYAVTAAAQAGNYYASRAADKMPELYQLAYSKYLNEFNMKLNELGALQQAEQSDFDKYLTELSQYNTDRNFDRQKWLDEYSMLNTNLGTLIALENEEYSRHQDTLSQHNLENSFKYQQLLDEISHQADRRSEEAAAKATEFEKAYNLAALGGRYGDYSGLNDLGITPTVVESGFDWDAWDRQLDLAKLAAEHGDYSLLKALGITPKEAGVVDELTDEQVEHLVTTYGGKELSEEDFQDLEISGYSREALEAAGFTVKQ